jgi:acetaldehyde dehydrogenase (acetylating)
MCGIAEGCLREGSAMTQDTVRVAVIGGGRTGTPLIERLLATPYVHIVGVADLDPESAGAVLAKDSGVFFTTDPMMLAAKGEDIDLLIEVSGDLELKGRLKKAFVDCGNRHTIILQEIAVRLFVSMLSGSETLMPSYHPGDLGIG